MTTITHVYRQCLLTVLLLTVPYLHGSDYTLLILGDSLSAAHGIDEADSWVSLLEQRLQQQATAVTVINASSSGETTAGALRRLPGLLQKHRPDALVIELGGNDGLRGFPIATFRQNLEKLITSATDQDIAVLLVGMHIPPNYGIKYNQLFYESYTKLAQKHAIPLVPFMLENVATNPQLMQADGIHPTAEAQAIILRNVYPYIKAIIDSQ